MGAYIVSLKDRQEIAEGTMAFYFGKPDGFDFAGGQSIDLTLIDPAETDAEVDKRAFSLASAPHEPDLMVATRMRDTAFKRVLKNLPPGSEVKVEGPFGSLTLHRKADRPAVILAGGIGITPFRSMLCQALRQNAGHRLHLFYSNRRPEDAAFLVELQLWAAQHPNFTLVATMTSAGKSRIRWNGETGHIDRQMLGKYVEDLAKPIYYLAGPLGLVAAMRDVLSESGVPDDDVNSEEFFGY